MEGERGRAGRGIQPPSTLSPTPHTDNHNGSIKNARFRLVQLDHHGPSDRWTDWQTDRRTVKACYRVACPQLKRASKILYHVTYTFHREIPPSACAMMPWRCFIIIFIIIFRIQRRKAHNHIAWKKPWISRCSRVLGPNPRWEKRSSVRYNQSQRTKKSV